MNDFSKNESKWVVFSISWILYKPANLHMSVCIKNRTPTLITCLCCLCYHHPFYSERKSNFLHTLNPLVRTHYRKWLCYSNVKVGEIRQCFMKSRVLFMSCFMYTINIYFLAMNSKSEIPENEKWYMMK